MQAVKESSYLEGGQVRFSTKKFNEDNDIQEDQIEVTIEKYERIYLF
jgi:hypothetical protein